MERLEASCDYFLCILDGKYGLIKEAVVVLLIVLFFNVFMTAFLRQLHRRFSQQNKPWQDSFVLALEKPLSYYVWAVAIVNALNLMYEKLTSQGFFEELHLILAMGGIIAFAWFLLRWKKNVVNFMTVRSRKNEIAMDPNKVDVIGKLVTMIIIFTTILLLLEVSHRSMNTLLAFGGIGGLAIAIASQEIIGNFFGGFMIYFTQPFTVGDWILLTDREIEGHVEEIGWYMTRIRTFNKRPIYVPNSIFFKIVVMNPSRMSHRQIKEIIGIRCTDMPVLKPVVADIKKMLSEHPEVDREERIIVNFTDFGSYSLNILIDAYVTRIDAVAFAGVKEDILLKIADILTKHGADMPFPSTVVHMPEGLVLKNNNQGSSGADHK